MLQMTVSCQAKTFGWLPDFLRRRFSGRFSNVFAGIDEDQRLAARPLRIAPD
jgi:hypothetical protein